MPEVAGPPGFDEPPAPTPADPPSAVSAEPFLSRLELELPDGRYLLSYRHLEEAGGGDA